ncbi:hypothetical protein OIU79_009630 [Salix purpurea]|uniref:Uncharacterized protein n=1 Tax=Salix purpurea TaxID=77065 RepID=A0A9Q0QDR2_SALPP|nr:hypothetical protein OIU79_009630 [Salix purpurea]
MFPQSAGMGEPGCVLPLASWFGSDPAGRAGQLTEGGREEAGREKRKEKELRQWGLCCSSGGRGSEDSVGRAASGGWEADGKREEWPVEKGERR